MPRKAQQKVDTTILEMAIVGYQSQLEGISAKIADIKTQLGQPGPGRPKATVAAAAVALGRPGPTWPSCVLMSAIFAAIPSSWL